MLFKIQDYQNIPVILTKNTWKNKLLDPVFGHPEVKPYILRIKRVIRKPEYVFQSIRDPRSKLFFAKIESGQFADYFLAVVVKYVQEERKVIGYVVTVMINRKLPKSSKLLWQNKRLI